MDKYGQEPHVCPSSATTCGYGEASSEVGSMFLAPKVVLPGQNCTRSQCTARRAMMSRSHPGGSWARTACLPLVCDHARLLRSLKRGRADAPRSGSGAARSESPPFPVYAVCSSDVSGPSTQLVGNSRVLALRKRLCAATAKPQTRSGRPSSLW